MATRANPLYCATKIHGGNVVPAYQLERFKPHRHRVLELYKKSLRQLELHWGVRTIHGSSTVPYHMIAYEGALIRARFEQNKHVKSLGKATELLKDGEEEFWINQGRSSARDGWMPNSSGGIAYQRHSGYHAESIIFSEWGADEWARWPDTYDNYKKWHALRAETWDEEMNTLQDADAKTIAAGDRLTNELPAAKEADGPPPFWWKYVTRPHEHVSRPWHDYTEFFNKYQ